jgi:hypothetical protein
MCVPFGKCKKSVGLFLMRGIQENAFSVCVCEMHQNMKLLAAALPEQKDYRFLFENLVCSRLSQNCMFHRCSNCPGQSQLQTVIEELFQANDSDVEDCIIYKHWVHDGHTKLYPWQVLLENSMKKSAEQQIKQQPNIIQQNRKLHIRRCWKKPFC